MWWRDWLAGYKIFEAAWQEQDLPASAWGESPVFSAVFGEEKGNLFSSISSCKYRFVIKTLLLGFMISQNESLFEKTYSLVS